MATFAELIGAADSRLTIAGVDSSRLDANVLLQHAAGLDRSALVARLRDGVSADVAARFERLVERREKREPLAYIVGEKEFFSLSFLVSPQVLIPRPETELLVEAALHSLSGAARVCDVGTGSGCIAVAIANSARAVHVVACDLSLAALAVAGENARRHAVDERVEFVCCDLLGGIDEFASFDLIVSNPPYVAAGEVLATELDWEPSLALRAGSSGMDAIERLLSEALPRLNAGAAILVEFGSDQEARVRGEAVNAGYRQIEILRDLAGHPRLLRATR